MISPSDILVITTDSPSGTNILKHLKPVSSHIVTGTNLFSDFLGGMSDIFGGRSHSYQNQLVSIYNEAIEKIKFEAYKLGANCVVGLRIDIDEISGKGKSMFMITAIGTAVILQTEDNKVNNESRIGFVGREQIDHLKNCQAIIEQVKIKKLNFSDSIWEFVIQNSMIEVYPEVIRQLKVMNENPTYLDTDESIKNFYSNTETYLRSLPIDQRKDLIYKSIEDEVVFIQKYLIKFIMDHDLLDIEKCMNLITHNDLKIKKIGLVISRYDKPYYSQADINNYQKLIELIVSNFKERGKIDSKTTMLSSKERKIWICECGKPNNIEEKYCSKCYSDIFGFESQERKPGQVIDFINSKLSLIEDLKAV